MWPLLLRPSWFYIPPLPHSVKNAGKNCDLSIKLLHYNWNISLKTFIQIATIQEDNLLYQIMITNWGRLTARLIGPVFLWDMICLFYV